MDHVFRKDVPIYTQLIEKMIDDIVSGELAPGDKIDSVREMAQKVGVNPNTVQRALSDLENKGLVITNRTSGRVVTEDADLIRSIREEMLESKTRTFVESMSKLSVCDEDIIDLVNKVIGEMK